MKLWYLHNDVTDVHHHRLNTQSYVHNHRLSAQLSTWDLV